MWREVISSLHFSSHSFSFIPCSSAATGIWKGICQVSKLLEDRDVFFGNHFVGKLGDGKMFRFWLDNWSGFGEFRIMFPSLFKLESNKWVLVADRVDINNIGEDYNWKWRNRWWTRMARVELSSLRILLQKASSSAGKDSWCWVAGGTQGFSVKMVRYLLLPTVSQERIMVFPWNNLLPGKINIFGWRALLNRLPTKDSLAIRNIHTGPLTCVLCESGDETLEHIMTGCSFTQQLWSAIEDWCNLSPIVAFSIKDVIFLHDQIGGSSTRKLMIQSVVLVTCWVIWKARNRMVFSKKNSSVAELLLEVKSSGFLWIKNRIPKMELDEKCWFDFSF